MAAMEDAFFAGSNQETTEAIKAWAMNEIKMRMDLAGRAVDFMNNLESKQKRVVEHAHQQVERVNAIITDFNTTKDQLKALFSQIEVKMGENDQKLQTVPELSQALAEKFEQITTLYQETQAFAVKSEKNLLALNQKTADFADKITHDLEGTKVALIGETIKLRDEIVTWSDGYIQKVEGMVKSGDFKYERGSSAPMAKFDKKEVSVWKLADGASKPDFRHWVDSVDLQLEAIHSFAYPDLELEKINRLTSEVTEAALMKIIKDINDEHKLKVATARLAEGGGPPPEWAKGILRSMDDGSSGGRRRCQAHRPQQVGLHREDLLAVHVPRR